MMPVPLLGQGPMLMKHVQKPPESSTVESKAEAVADACCALIGAGETRKAAALLAAALLKWPGHHDLKAAARAAQSHGIPEWHLSMVADERRNEAYERAIDKAVKPGMTVLDIGTGSGLLAMMAARAGAARVLTCEVEPRLAESARQIIKLNGYSDRITVLTSHSRSLDAHRDLAGGADLLVTEIFGNPIIQEGALPVVEHAMTHLMRQGARIIPGAGSVEIALAFDGARNRKSMGQVRGFDLSFFNRHAPVEYTVRSNDAALELRGPSTTLFKFDFHSGGPFAKSRSTVSLTSNGGVVNGIAMWIRLQLDETGVYENRPQTEHRSHWRVLFTRFGQPLETGAGDAVQVYGRHNRTEVKLWSDAH
jgi:type III protein arginine methyltransferase